MFRFTFLLWKLFKLVSVINRSIGIDREFRHFKYIVEVLLIDNQLFKTTLKPNINLIFLSIFLALLDK